VSDEPVDAVPAELRFCVGPSGYRQREAGVEEPLRVGAHPSEIADAKIMMLRTSSAHPADHAMTLRVTIHAPEHHGH
jgi:hypothetical protein